MRHLPSTKDELSRLAHTTARLGGTAIAATGVAVALTGGSLTAPVPAAPQQAQQAATNPFDVTRGFLAFVHHDAELVSNETEGTIAIGGNLILGNTYNVGLHTAGTFTVDDDAEPAALLVGGRIDWADSAADSDLRVINGWAKIGDLTGTDVAQQGTSPTELVPAGDPYGALPRVDIQHPEPTAAVPGSDLIDFDAAFATLLARSRELAECPTTVVPTDANGAPLTRPIPPGSQAYITLEAGRTNVLNLTATELANISVVTFRGTDPGPDTPLLVNVDTTDVGDDVTWSPPPGIDRGSDPDHSSVLLNFPTARTITLTGGNSIRASILAPLAHLADHDPGNVEGNIAVSSYEHGSTAANGGEQHQFPFDADLGPCVGATESPSPSASPTTSPSTNPSASPSATPSESPSESPSTTPTPTTTGPSTTPTPTPTPTSTHSSPTPMPSMTPPPRTLTPTPSGSARPSPTRTGPGSATTPPATTTEHPASPTASPRSSRGPARPCRAPVPPPRRPSPSARACSPRAWP